MFGNEKTGLAQDELQRSDLLVRIPMAADQPSINLAQAVQILAYEQVSAGTQARAETADPPREVHADGNRCSQASI